MASPPPVWQKALKRWGYLADAEAKRWGVKDGATLLAKVGYVETGWSTDLSIESPAEARGPTQFIPSTRESYIQTYHIDPWASVDQAVHAAAIYMKTSGLDNYNPGSSTYVGEVLNAPVGKVSSSDRRASTLAAASPRGSSSPAPSGSGATGALHFLLTAALVLGGLGVAGFGISRATGAQGGSE